MNFTMHHKTDVERQIVEAIASALDKKELTEEQLPEISSFILSRIDLITDSDELLVFLSDLSNKWPSFINILDIEKGKIKEITEQEAAVKAAELIKNGSIDDAMNLVKNTNSQN